MILKNLIGPRAKVHPTAELEAPVRVYGTAEIKAFCRVGAYTYMGNRCVISRDSIIGRYCSLARDVEIGADEHPTNFLSTHPFQYQNTHFSETLDYSDISRVDFSLPKGAEIGHDVWIGAKVFIRRAVKVGHGAIIASNSVVTKDVPPYAIVGGTPAKIIRYRFNQDIINALLELEWWNLPINTLKDISFNDITSAIQQIKKIKDAHTN